MQPPRVRYPSDGALVRGIVSGAADAWVELSERYREALLDVVRPAAADARGCDLAVDDFLASLRRDPARAFASYRADRPLARYLIRLLSNHLAPKVLQAIREGPERGFALFDRVYGLDIRRAIRNLFARDRLESDGRVPEDVYHDVLAHLMQDGGRRLLAFDGKGAFSVYLKKIVRNYWVDSIRHQHGRRRLPEAIQALPPLEQVAFRLMAWDGLSGHEAIEQLRASAAVPEPEDRLQAAIDRIIPYIAPSAPRGAEPVTTLPEPKPDVVSALLRWQRVRSPQSELLTRLRKQEVNAALERLRDAIQSLPEDQRAFLTSRYFAERPLTPREIARQWQRPVEQVYEVGRRAMASLRATVGELGLKGLEL